MKSFSQISDFGLAKLMPEGQETHVTARVLGTFGYFDPEYTSVSINPICSIIFRIMIFNFFIFCSWLPILAT